MSSVNLLVLVQYALLLTTFACFAGGNIFDEPSSSRDCNWAKDEVCTQSACAVTVCPRFKNAICEAVRCGCEARFMNWMAAEDYNADVTKLCSPTGPLTVSADQMNRGPPKSYSELKYRQLFESIHVSVTGFLKQIGMYLWENNRIKFNEADTEKINFIVWSIELRSKLGKLAAADDDSDANSIEGLSLARELIQGVLKINTDLLSDDIQEMVADLEVTTLLASLLAEPSGTVEDLRMVVFREDGTTPSIVGRLYAVDSFILDDLLKDTGVLVDAVRSGKVIGMEDGQILKALRNAFLKFD